ncbi:MAG: hypothetical protein LQ337_001313 [Flavoplaca oasis]|nr:MAG: hypothetical protein LQ337_001313 [Flavoplaca oasis]
MGEDTLGILDRNVCVSEDAPETTKKLWSLHGHPYSDRYSDSSLNSIGALVKYAAATYKGEAAFVYPASESEEEDSYRIITWDDFHRISDVVSTIYCEKLSTELANANNTRTQPTVALLGRATGIDFYITIVALQKLNVRVLLVSNALSPSIVQVLYDRCKALAMIVDEEYWATQLSVARKISLVENPFDLPKPTTAISVTRYEDGLDPWNRPSIVIHSSGSTGVPKPIIHTNGSLLLIARTYRLLPSYHIENWYLLFPLSSIASNVILPSGFPHGLATIFPPRGFPPSPETIFKCLHITARLGLPIDCLHANPQLIETICSYVEGTTKDYSTLRKLKVLQPGGAPLARHVAMKPLEEDVNLKQVYGSSELNILMRTYPHNRSNRRVQSMRLIPLPGINTHVKLEPVDAEYYELVVHRGFPCAAQLWGSGLGTQVETGQVFRTNDLFVRDEVMGEGNWILKGRKDDMLILASGRVNVSAVEVESVVKKEGAGLVRAAMLVGHGRDKTGLLVELHEDEYAGRVLDDVVKMVHKVNEDLTEGAKIGDGMVKILEKGKELPVGVKGNVRRKEAQERYQTEIEALYTR